MDDPRRTLAHNRPVGEGGPGGLDDHRIADAPRRVGRLGRVTAHRAHRGWQARVAADFDERRLVAAGTHHLARRKPETRMRLEPVPTLRKHQEGHIAARDQGVVRAALDEALEPGEELLAVEPRVWEHVALRAGP